MTDRILDFSSQSAKLRVKHRQLEVTLDPESPPRTFPLAEIAMMLVSHPQVHFSHAVLAGLCEHGGVLIVCDGKSLPTGILLPINAHHAQVARFEKQACLKQPVKKRLWREVVRRKIENQAAVLKLATGSDAGLVAMAAMVRSGDPANVEAQAARRYWPRLFPTESFKRLRTAADQNLMLNYGYAVLRAIVARAICASGLHPSLGLHHHNRSSGYPLADDLMEPLRPVVDARVLEFVRQYEEPKHLTKVEKEFLISHLLGRFPHQGEQRTLFDIAARMTASLTHVIEGDARKLELPEI